MGILEQLGLKAPYGGQPDSTEQEIRTQLESQILTGIGSTLVTPEENFKSYIKNGYQANLVINSAINYIIRRASDIPIRLMRRLPDGDKEEIFNHPALDRIRKPNEIQDTKEFVQQALGFKLLTGNTYVWKMLSNTRENDPVPLKMYVLPSQFMDIKTGGSLNEVIDYYVMDTIAKGKFRPEEIIHWRSPNFDYENGQWLIGQSPIRAALQTLNVNNSNEIAMAKAAQNQGAMGLLMKDVADNQPMTPEQTRQVQNAINKKVQGVDNKGRIVAVSRSYKWQQLGMTAADMQLIETSKMTMRQLLAIYGLDSKLFNDPEAQSYNNMQEARKGAYTETILPLMEDFASKLTQSLLEGENDLEFVIDRQNIEALKEDNSKLIATLSNADFIPTSEKQRMVGIEPDGVLPEYLISGNKIPLDGMTAGMGDQESKKLDALYTTKSFTDYPQAASDNAQRAIDYKEKNGSDCGTQVGWTRASQLADRKPITLETVKRTFSFLSRSESFADGNDLSDCGLIMYLAWGGDEMKRWAERTINKEED